MNKKIYKLIDLFYGMKNHKLFGWIYMRVVYIHPLGEKKRIMLRNEQ